MKKTFATLLSILLCVTMVLSFAACGEETPAVTTDNDTATTTTAASVDDDEPATPVDEEEEPSIIGSWKGSIDLAEQLTQTYASMGLELTITDFTITYIYTFAEDGNVAIELDQEGFNEAMIGVLEQAAEAMGVTYEQMIEETGMTEEEYLQAASAAYNSVIGDSTYEFDGSNLTLHTAQGDNTVAVELTTDTLTFETMGVELVLEKQ